MYAAIDLGSNSFHLLIARVHKHGIEEYDRYSEKVQLAEGLIDSGRLSSAAMTRAFECLGELRDHMSWYELHDVEAVGTFALREAKNSADFVARAEALLGMPIMVLTGEQEAELIYRGVQKKEELSQPALIIDIGGGSTEFAIGNGEQIDLLFSESMGCVTLRDQYFHDTLIRRGDFQRALQDVAQWVQLPACRLDEHQWQQTWGSSGTMKAVARILNGLHGCGYIIHQPQLHSLLEDMLKRKRYADLNYPFLNDDRKALILPGIAIIVELMDELGIDTLNVSQASLREGLVWKMASET